LSHPQAAGLNYLIRRETLEPNDFYLSQSGLRLGLTPRTKAYEGSQAGDGDKNWSESRAARLW